MLLVVLVQQQVVVQRVALILVTVALEKRALAVLAL
jgi:hypothetical protein